MFELGGYKTANFIRPFYVVYLVFLLKESLNQTLNHGYVISLNFFYALRVVVNVANLLPEVTDDVKVLGNNLP